MTGFDSVILGRSASIRDGTGSRYPLGAPIAANSALNAFRGAAARGFARLQPIMVAQFA